MKITIESKEPVNVLTNYCGEKYPNWRAFMDQFVGNEWKNIMKDIDPRKKAKITITIEQE